MKHIIILACIVSLGIYTSGYAQDNQNADSLTVTADADMGMDEEIGLNNAIFSSSATKSNYGGCSLIKEGSKERQVYTYKNGYKIVTGDKEEVVKVKRYKDGGRKIKYSNDFESFKYHIDDDGEMHYSYSYDNYECKKVRVKRSKKGITSVTNKSEAELDEVKGNVKTSMDQGLNSCFLVR
jgi:hypothetical protein